MIVKSNKAFKVGLGLAMTFLAVLVMIFSPIFNGQNGLMFADDSFNKLAKGSSYFIPKVLKSIETTVGKTLASTIKIDKAEEAEKTAKLFQTAGAEVTLNGAEITIKGDMAGILKSAVADADAMYKNDGKTVADRYGYDEKQAMKNWWSALSKVEKNLKKDKLVAEAKVVSDVNKKAIEPGYNFYKIDGQKVSEHAGMMSGLLVFYVAYTMWWGYSIFYLFEGFGLTMKKAKVKKEA